MGRSPWEWSGIMGRSPEGGGAATDTSRPVWAKAARTGQQRLWSRVVPQAWLQNLTTYAPV